MPKNVKGRPLGLFEHPFFWKIEKIERETLWRYLKNLRKSHKAEITYTKKFWSSAGLEPTSFGLADLKTAQLPSMPSASSVSVSVSASQLIKFIQSVTSLVLKKTSRERPKSTPYLRLKNSKRTSKCQVFSSTVPV